MQKTDNGNGAAADGKRLSPKTVRALMKLGGLAAGGVGVAMMLDECDMELVAGSNLLVVSAILLAAAFIGESLASRT
jgi:hypothetical protein